MTSTILRQEVAHSINGVSGRLHNVIAWPAAVREGYGITIANQTWTSERRPVSGYGDKAQMSVTVRFDDNCKNGSETFSITAEVVDLSRRSRDKMVAGGCMHEEIAEVFPELAGLSRWHLTSQEGPLHYIANTVYHAGNGDFRAARNTANWPEAPDAELSVEPEALKAALIARLADLQAGFRAMLEGAGFMLGVPVAA